MPLKAEHADLSGPEHRRSDARRTHARILRAATELILSRQQLSMSGLARAAGVSRPTLYDHFASVEDVVEAAVERAVALGLQAPELDHDDGANPPERMAQLLRTRWQSLADHTELYRLASEVLPPGRMQAVHQNTVGNVTELIDIGKRTGDFRDDLPTEWLVAVVYGLLHQAAEEVLAGRLRQDRAGELLSRTVLSTLGHRD